MNTVIMNIKLEQRIEVLCVLVVVIALSISVQANDTGGKNWTNYYNTAVVGENRSLARTNHVLRYGVETNLFEVFRKNERWLRAASESSVPTMRQIRVKTMEFDAKNAEQSQRVRVRMVEGVNSRDEAMTGLVHLMSSSTSMGGRPYKEFLAGIGDVCFVFKTEPKTGMGPSILFFCRDNVAIEVASYSSQTDIAALARLIDSSIIASHVKESQPSLNTKPGGLSGLDSTNSAPVNPNPTGK
jgi:hypothetical protein